MHSNTLVSDEKVTLRCVPKPFNSDEYSLKVSVCVCCFCSRTRKKMQNVSNLSILTMLIMYMLSALFGYLTFYGKSNDTQKQR